MKTLVAPLLGVLVLAVMLGGAAAPADASCDVIPAAAPALRAVVGTVDRPFAAPGDWIELSSDPTSCERSAGFDGVPADQLAVVLTFTPPIGDPSLVLLLPDRFDDGDGENAEEERLVQAAVADCNGALSDVGSTSRLLRLRVRNAAGQASRPWDIETMARSGERPAALRLRFPDTAPATPGQPDARELSGPVRIVVARRDEVASACRTAMEPCDPMATSFPLACVDALLARGGCANVPDEPFASFTALPRPNDFSALCTEPSPPCTGTETLVRATLDADGNLLVPVDWTGVLVRRDEVPVPRLLLGATKVSAFEQLLGPIRIPGSSFLESFAPEGRRLPPLFEPQLDGTSLDALQLFGSADAPYSVLRVRARGARGVCEDAAGTTGATCSTARECAAGETCRRFLVCGDAEAVPCTGGADEECGAGDVACQPTACSSCVGGARDGAACRNDAECGQPDGACRPIGPACADDASCPVGSRCGPTLFDFAGRLDGEDGLAATLDRAVALDPVPLGGLLDPAPGDGLQAFVLAEPILVPRDAPTCEASSDLNGDGDCDDPVLVVQDVTSGAPIDIGAMRSAGRARGRAVARVARGGFRFPAVDVEGDVAAFLEPEPLEGPDAGGDADRNGNGLVFDTLLRVADRTGRDLTAHLPDRLLTADAAPVIDGHSVAVSGGRVFFRTAEADLARRHLEDVGSPGADSGDETSDHVAFSGDGRFMAFSTPGALVPDDRNGIRDVYVLDRDADEDRVFDEPGGTSVVRESVGADGRELGDYSDEPSLSADGRWLAFTSRAADVVPGDTNGTWDVFVRDRTMGTVARVSVLDDGSQAFLPGRAPMISGNGQVVVFELRSDDDHEVFDQPPCTVMRHDQQTGLTTYVGAGHINPFGGRCIGTPTVSADGLRVAYRSSGWSEVDENDDVIVHQLAGVYVHEAGQNVLLEDESALFSGPGGAPQVFADGSAVAWWRRPADFDGANGPLVVLELDGRRRAPQEVPLPDSLRFFEAVVSPDGRLVAVMDPGEDSIAGFHIVVYDRRSRRESRLVVPTGDREFLTRGRPAFSLDGRTLGTRASVIEYDDDFETIGTHDEVVAQSLARNGEAIDAMRLPLGFDSGVTAGRDSKPALSGDGRTLAFLHERFTSEGFETTLSVLDRASKQTEQVTSGVFERPSLSHDGTRLVFTADSFVPNACYRQVHLREGRQTRVLPGRPPSSFDCEEHEAQLSADGRVVTFTHDELSSTLVMRHTIGSPSAQVVSLPGFDGREPQPSADGSEIAVTATPMESGSQQIIGVTGTGSPTLLSQTADGRPAVFSTMPSVSANGRRVAFETWDDGVAPGDDNGLPDVFVHDRDTGSTERVPATSAGATAPFGMSGPALAANGRIVAALSTAADFFPALSLRVLLHDTISGMTASVPIPDRLHAASRPVLSADGRTLALDATTPDLEGSEVLVYGPDLQDRSADLDGDGKAVSTLLRVFDPARGETPLVLGQASAASVDGGRVAFVAGDELSRDGGPLYLWTPEAAQVRPLGRTAVEVKLHENLLAARVTAAGATPSAAVYDVEGARWTDLRRPADTIAVAGRLVVLTAPDADSHCPDDGQPQRVLAVYDAAGARFVLDTRIPVRDVVASGKAGRELIAFRTPECARQEDLNGDGDLDDDVLQVFDHLTGRVLNTGEAIRPCRLEACDPDLPYRVGEGSVTFLTFECDDGRDRQPSETCPGLGSDLDNNGRVGDLIVQTIELRHALDTGAEPAREVLASAKAGVCTGSAAPCASHGDCPAEGALPGFCFVPPGGCVEVTGAGCFFPDAEACSEGQFCSPTIEDEGVCVSRLADSCVRDTDCKSAEHPAAVCNATALQLDRLAAPLRRASRGREGEATVFTGAGRCVEDVACDPEARRLPRGCRPGSCSATAEDATRFTCARPERTCRTDADCVGLARCEPELVTTTAADSDEDGVIDVIDVCPEVKDVAQQDSDGDGVGDACDPMPEIEEGGCVREPTMASAQCRARLLEELTMMRLPPSKLREALRRQARHVQDRLDDAGRPGRAGRKALGRAVRRTSKYAHLISSRAARRKVEDVVRTDLLERATDLRADLRSLRRQPATR